MTGNKPRRTSTHGGGRRTKSLTHSRKSMTSPASAYSQKVMRGDHHDDDDDGDRPFPCPVCDYRAKIKSNLRQHMSVHSDDRPFHCHLCNHTAKLKSNLIQHMKSHQDIGHGPTSSMVVTNGKGGGGGSGHKTMYTCPHCEYVTKNGGHLKRHLIGKHNEIIDGDSSLSSMTTSTTSSSPSSSSIHQFYAYKRAHSNLWDLETGQHSVAGAGETSRLECDLCDYTCAHAGSLKIHVRSKHAIEKPFKCTRCHFETMYSYFLTQHVATCRGTTGGVGSGIKDGGGGGANGKIQRASSEEEEDEDKIMVESKNKENNSVKKQNGRKTM